VREQQLDEIVRSALVEMAGEAQVVPLLGGATQRARRIRRRRAVVAAGVAAAVVLALFVVPPGRPKPGEQPARPGRAPGSTEEIVPMPMRSVTPVPDRVGLGDGFTVTAIGVIDGSSRTLWLLDRGSGAFVGTGAGDADLAPAGPNVILATDEGQWLADLSTRTMRRRAMLHAVPRQQWAPDLRTVIDPESAPGWLHLVDVVSGARQDVRLQVEQTGCEAEACAASWYRPGESVAVAEFDPATGAQIGTRVLSAVTGAPIAALPVKGRVAGPGSWSPDGRYVAVTATDERIEIVEVTTGRRTARLPDGLNPNLMAWSSATRLLVPTGPAIDTFTPDGAHIGSVTVPGATWVMAGPG
jgi:hypothetical protein